MDVISDTAHTEAFTLCIAGDGREIGEQVGSNSVIKKGYAILRAENHVDKKQR
ncbi:MAG TPA: hypothetical protein VGN16_00230 [Acidobacteriaceae bacterium]|jgi:hypothetical protein